VSTPANEYNQRRTELIRALSDTERRREAIKKSMQQLIQERDRDIFRRHQEGMCQKALAMDFNLDRSTVCLILQKFRPPR
jgi:FixJ family two-component response regulator